MSLALFLGQARQNLDKASRPREPPFVAPSESLGQGHVSAPPISYRNAHNTAIPKMVLIKSRIWGRLARTCTCVPGSGDGAA